MAEQQPNTGDAIAGFMRAWTRHETAPRTACSECHFESGEGYPPSHAPGCSQDQP